VSEFDYLDDDDWNDDPEYDYDDEREEDPGCVLGDRCLCPHVYHFSWECFTAEDAERWMSEETP